MNNRTKANIVYTVWAIVYLGVFFLFVFRNWPVILTFAYIIIGYLMYKLIPKFLGRSFSRVLSKECDPEKHLTAVNKAFPKERREYKNTQRSIKANTAISFLLCAGLSASGKFEEALSELNKITVFTDGSSGDFLKAVYLACLTSVYINLKDISLAEDTLAQLHAILENKEFSAGRQKKLINEYNECGYLLGMAKGEFEGAEQFFISEFDTAKSNLGRVYAKFHLGEVYSHFGDTAKALEAFEYAAAHGNKLYKASLARENLKKIEST